MLTWLAANALIRLYFVLPTRTRIPCMYRSGYERFLSVCSSVCEVIVESLYFCIDLNRRRFTKSFV